MCSPIAGAVVGAALLVSVDASIPPAFAALRMAAAEVTTPVSSGLRGRRGAGSRRSPRVSASYFGVQRRERALARRARSAAAIAGAARAHRRLRQPPAARALLALRDRTAAGRRRADWSARPRRARAASRMLNAGPVAGRPARPAGARPRRADRPRRRGRPERGARAAAHRHRQHRAGAPRRATACLRSRPGAATACSTSARVDTTDVRFGAGDVFVTSGTGGLYPPGIPVARVIRGGSDHGRSPRRSPHPDTLDFALVTPAVHAAARAAPRPERTPVSETIDYRPLRAAARRPHPARALPWLTVAGLAAHHPAGRRDRTGPAAVRAADAARLAAAAPDSRCASGPPLPLGLFDDLVSGQPLGSAMLLWTLCFLAIDVLEQRLVWRDFWQDWLIAVGRDRAAAWSAAAWSPSPLARACRYWRCCAQIAVAVLLLPAGRAPRRAGSTASAGQA